MKKAALLAMAGVLYAGAAWMVAPGFYDGFAPPQPYNFVCPPPQAGANLPPTSGTRVIKVIDGVSDANTAFTDDGQVVIGFLPGSFDVTGKTQVTVTIKPVSPCVHPSGLSFSTNVYEIAADAPLIKPATLVMLYSNLVTDPSFVYRSTSPDGPWTSIGASPQARLWTIDTKTDKLGYFAAGFPSGAISHPGSSTGGQQILPWVVAALIAAVLLAGIPLTIVRRRAAREEEDDEA